MSSESPSGASSVIDVLTLRRGRVHMPTRTLHPHSGGTVLLTTLEANLLAKFVANPNRVLTCEELLLNVWGRTWGGEPEALGVVRNAVFRLRQKLERDAAAPDHILTTQGEGYTFVLLQSTPSPIVPSAAEAPGDAWSEAWDVGRAQEEAEALAVLERPHRPLVIQGCWRVGKTWFLRRLTKNFSEDDVVVVLDPRALEREVLEDPRQLLYALAQSLGESVGLADEAIEQAWAGPGTAGLKLRRLMERKILPSARGRVIIALDDADRLSRFAAYLDTFAMLRAWSEDQRPVWKRLRVVLTTATSPVRLTARLVSSPFNIGAVVSLDDLDPLAVSELTSRYGVSASVEELEALRQGLGGHPLLVRLALAGVARAGSLGLSLSQISEQLLSFADELRSKILAVPGLDAALRQAREEPERALPDDLADDLLRLGLILHARPPYRARYPVLDRLLRL